jgi:hypothetical protein
MVDALRCAHEWVRPDGVVVDVHPSATPAWLEVDGRPLGPLDAGDAPERHARASGALARAIGEGLFAVTAAVDFTFASYGDSIEELRDHVAAHWRSTRIGPALVDAAHRRLRVAPGAPLRVVEAVTLTRLRPAG